MLVPLMQVSLHTSALASTAHEAIFLPWLKRVAARRRHFAASHCGPRPTPRGRLLSQVARAGQPDGPVEAALSYPQRPARTISTATFRLHPRIPSREHLRLLLATAAERVAASAGAEVAASVAAGAGPIAQGAST